MRCSGATPFKRTRLLPVEGNSTHCPLQLLVFISLFLMASWSRNLKKFSACIDAGSWNTALPCCD